ncbi:solute carrier family 35 member F6-like [Glandiceps talaboti]
MAGYTQLRERIQLFCFPEVIDKATYGDSGNRHLLSCRATILTVHSQKGGFFGFMFLSLLLIPFYYINAGDLRLDSPGHRLEDAIDAFYQMANNHLLILAFLGNMVSIAFFNFAGISVTKEISATTRMVLDSVRTVVIWGISCLLRWENFLALEVLGFVLLICGQCIYNDIIFTPFLRKRGVCLQCLQTGEGDESEHDPLINWIKENSLPHSKDAINA